MKAAKLLDEERPDEAWQMLSSALLDCDETRFVPARYAFVERDRPLLLRFAPGIGDAFPLDKSRLYVAAGLVAQGVHHEALNVLRPRRTRSTTTPASSAGSATCAVVRTRGSGGPMRRSSSSGRRSAAAPGRPTSPNGPRRSPRRRPLPRRPPPLPSVPAIGERGPSVRSRGPRRS
ncbi:hypothetical protein [Streptomyces sp. NPDC058623]|uniref:hypothetical protein n=1 Tax=Streptomyces sp. NPDC058623 TaxID=3346563 RepID=UPI0036559E8C